MSSWSYIIRQSYEVQYNVMYCPPVLIQVIVSSRYHRYVIISGFIYISLHVHKTIILFLCSIDKRKSQIHKSILFPKRYLIKNSLMLDRFANGQWIIVYPSQNRFIKSSSTRTSDYFIIMTNLILKHVQCLK